MLIQLPFNQLKTLRFAAEIFKNRLSSLMLLCAMLLANGLVGQTTHTVCASGCHFETIQAAIDDAGTVNGDIIQVAAGSYSESVTVNKAIHLKGANAGIPAANGSGVDPGGRGSETIMINGGPFVFRPTVSNITIDGFKFTGGSGRLIDTYEDSDDFVITNNVFDIPSGAADGGVIQMGGGSKAGLTVTNNSFQGVGTSSWLYLAGNNASDVAIEGNDFLGSGSRGIFLAGGIDYENTLIKGNFFGSSITTGINMNGLIAPVIEENLFEVTYAAMQIGADGGFIRNNTIDGSSQVGVDFSQFTGFGVQAWGLTLWANSQNLTVSGNTISSIVNPAAEPGEFDLFAAIGLSGTFGTGIVIEKNIIEGNSLAIRVNTDQSGDIEILNNAIVDNSLGILNQKTTSVDANCNWWGDVAGPEAGQTEGAVDVSLWLNSDDLENPACIGPVYNITQDTYYGTIQAAIDDAGTVNGDIIQVAAGTYDENVNINKPLTLTGANAGNDCESRGVESVIAPSSGAPVMITSDNVTLNGFEINAPNHGFAIDLSNQSNVSVLYNKVDNIGNDTGFGGPPTNSNTVHSIRFQLDAGSYSDVDISNNCISNISHGGNTFNSTSGIGILQSTSQGTLSNLTIADNSISDVNSNTGPWGDGGRIAYGVLINVGGNANFATNGKVVDAVITGNHISNLEGFISTGIGLEGNTENAVVNYNVISSIKGSKASNREGGGYDLQALKFESNRYVGTVTVENNSFETNTFEHSDPDGVGYAVANYVDASAYGVADVSCNWFGTAVAAEIEDNVDLVGLLLSKAGAEISFIPFLQSDDLEGPCDGYPAGTVFVIDDNGDIVDFFMGATPISDAMGIANDGDLVKISSGVYNDVIDASGSPDPALNIAIGESPGCVTVTGLILTDNDTYEQDIWDYDPCTGYDQLTVDGDVSLGDAVLEIDLDGFMPAPGFAFEIITYTGARTGEFAQNTITINGRDYEVNYDDDNKVITVTGAGYANYTWTQSDVEVEACQETTVNVNIETLGDITNAELKLSYDATRLEVVSVTYMGSGATVASDFSVSGEIFFAAEWALSGGLSGPGEPFLEIVFKGIRDDDDNTGTTGGIVEAIEFGQFNGTRIVNNYGFIGDAIEPVWADVLLDAETLNLDVTPDDTDPVINGNGACLSLDDSRFVNSGNGYLVSGDEFDVITGATDDCATPTITHNASSITGADGSAATSAASLDGWNLPVGTHTITFTASDGFNSVTCPVVITVVPQTLTGNAIINMACNDGADVRIRLYDGSTQVGGDFATTLDASGNFETPVELTGVPAGTYTVYAKIERYLSKVFADVDMTSSSAQPNIGLTQVIPGDIAGPSDDFNDDVINAADLSLLVNNYNTALDTNSPAPAVRCDLNCDNFVDAIDLSFISFFYGEFVSAP